MPLSEHVYCVAVAFKMTERVEQWICIKFCIKLEQSCTETILMVQKSTAMGNWWLAVSSRQHSHSHIMPGAEFLAKYQITQVTQPPYIPDMVPCDFWLFPKLKSPLKGNRFQTGWWDSGKYNGAADGNWENCVRSQGAYFKGDLVSLSCVWCFLYLLQ